MVENEKEWVKNFLIPKLLENEKLLNDTSKNSSKFQLHDISIRFVGDEESFMLTKCYKVKLDYEFNGKVYSNTMVVKKTPEISKDTYESINFDSLFHNEILGYTKIIPILNTSTYFPKYYYSHRKDLEAVIVLDDFSIDGWQMTKSKFNLSLEHILLAARNIGRFHGAGFALKKTSMQKFKEIISSIKESRFVVDTIPEEWEMMIKLSPQRAIKAVKKYQYSSEPIPDDFLEKLLKLLSGGIPFYRKIMKPIEPLATICHGDYLRNNVAFKYDEKNPDIPTDIIMFDLQTLRYSSPMIDLCIFLSLSAGKDVRSKNFDKIFQTYCNELAKVYCERTETTIEELPSHLKYDELLKEYIRYLPHGLAIACQFLNVLVGDNIPIDEILQNKTRPREEVINYIFTNGGETVDVELSALTHELYEFTVKYGVDIFERLL